MVQHAKPTDSGTYSCSPSLGDTVSVNVHVLRGNYPFSSVKKIYFPSFFGHLDRPGGLVSALAEKNIIEIVDRYIFLPKIILLFAREITEDFP